MDYYYFTSGDDSLQHHGIKGMKWGVRRYQNSDGTLTAKGKARYDRDIRENKSRKKDNRIDTSNPDPNRWVKEDTERSVRVLDSSGRAINAVKNLDRSVGNRRSKQPMDLSTMSDQQIRDAINRANLEQQYTNLFAKDAHPKIVKGREVARNILEVSGNILAVASAGLGVALAVKELRGSKS